MKWSILLSVLAVPVTSFAPVLRSNAAVRSLGMPAAPMALNSAASNEAQVICPLLPAGVLETVVGYSGSNDASTGNPTYRNIQDYSESMRITFDPNVISYERMVELFFQFHTPADPRWAGTQYRSAIFVHSEEQREVAENALKGRGAIARFIAIEDGSDFYRGEEYHQKYLEKVMM